MCEWVRRGLWRVGATAKRSSWQMFWQRRGGAVEDASCSSHVTVAMRCAAALLTYLDLQRRRFVVQGDRLSLCVRLGPRGGGRCGILEGNRDTHERCCSAVKRLLMSVNSPAAAVQRQRLKLKLSLAFFLRCATTAQLKLNAGLRAQSAPRARRRRRRLQAGKQALQLLLLFHLLSSFFTPCSCSLPWWDFQPLHLPRRHPPPQSLPPSPVCFCRSLACSSINGPECSAAVSPAQPL